MAGVSSMGGPSGQIHAAKTQKKTGAHKPPPPPPATQNNFPPPLAQLAPGTSGATVAQAGQPGAKLSLVG